MSANVAVAVLSSRSVTVAVTVAVPEVSGAPPIAPVADTVSPVGRPVAVQVKGEPPPVAASCAEYGNPAVPSGRLVVVTAGGISGTTATGATTTFIVLLTPAATVELKGRATRSDQSPAVRLADRCRWPPAVSFAETRLRQTPWESACSQTDPAVRGLTEPVTTTGTPLATAAAVVALTAKECVTTRTRTVRLFAAPLPTRSTHVVGRPGDLRVNVK